MSKLAKAMPGLIAAALVNGQGYAQDNRDLRLPQVDDLPLIEVPATSKSSTLAVVVTGDGGWASIDQQIGETLSNNGISVVGLNSMKYFWDKKSPEIAAVDLTRILSHYSLAWGASKFILIGYSRGADTLPFMVSRLPAILRADVAAIALLGLAAEVDFEFHAGSLLLNSERGDYKTIPEVRKLEGMNMLCVYGSDDDASACARLPKGLARIVEMDGGHHFDGDYKKLASIILDHYLQTSIPGKF